MFILKRTLIIPLHYGALLRLLIHLDWSLNPSASPLSLSSPCCLPTPPWAQPPSSFLIDLKPTKLLPTSGTDVCTSSPFCLECSASRYQTWLLGPGLKSNATSPRGPPWQSQPQRCLALLPLVTPFHITYSIFFKAPISPWNYFVSIDVCLIWCLPYETNFHEDRNYSCMFLAHRTMPGTQFNRHLMTE